MSSDQINILAHVDRELRKIADGLDIQARDARHVQDAYNASIFTDKAVRHRALAEKVANVQRYLEDVREKSRPMTRREAEEFGVQILPKRKPILRVVPTTESDFAASGGAA